MRLSEVVREFQTRFVQYALVEAHGNIRQAAKILGKSPATLDRWVGLLGLRDFARRLRYVRACVVVRRVGMAAVLGVAFFYPAQTLI
jgi:Bacterial regulatory protein, Fis family